MNLKLLILTQDDLSQNKSNLIHVYSMDEYFYLEKAITLPEYFSRISSSAELGMFGVPYQGKYFVSFSNNFQVPILCPRLGAD